MRERERERELNAEKKKSDMCVTLDQWCRSVFFCMPVSDPSLHIGLDMDRSLDFAFMCFAARQISPHCHQLELPMEMALNLERV